jgi:hypothetical protein
MDNNSNNIIKKIELSRLLQLVNNIKTDIGDFYAAVQSSNPHKSDFAEFNRKISEINANVNLLKTLTLNLGGNDGGNNDNNINEANSINAKENEGKSGKMKMEVFDEKAEEEKRGEEDDISAYLLKDELKNSIYEVIKINDALSSFLNKSINYNQQTISFIVNLFNKDYSCDYNKNASYNKNIKRSVCLVKDIQV